MTECPISETWKKCSLPSIECLIVKCQLRWTGNIIRMEDDRIPKMLLLGQFQQGHRVLGRPLKRYKDTLKAYLKSCNISVNSWEAVAKDRALQRHQIHKEQFPSKQTELLQFRQKKREVSKVRLLQLSSLVASAVGHIIKSEHFCSLITLAHQNGINIFTLNRIASPPRPAAIKPSLCTSYHYKRSNFFLSRATLARPNGINIANKCARPDLQQ